MKFKKFKKAVNQDSGLLTLKAKDLADIFEIEKYKAKYFKAKFKDELSYVPMEGFEICDCSSCLAARELTEVVNKPPSRYKQTDKLPFSPKSGSIIEVECVCPVCNEDIILDCFNSGETLVECSDCYTLLSLKDNVVKRFEGEIPKSKEDMLEYLLNEIENLKHNTK